MKTTKHANRACFFAVVCGTMLAGALALLVPGCSNPSRGEREPPPVVYVAGSYENDSNTYVPYYWKAGARANLSGGTGDGYAWSIAVAGASIYVAGSYNNGTTDVPCYWKIGGTRTDRTDLSGGATDGEALSIAVR